jgi:hypothetical protein
MDISKTVYAVCDEYGLPKGPDILAAYEPPLLYNLSPDDDALCSPIRIADLIYFAKSIRCASMTIYYGERFEEVAAFDRLEEKVFDEYKSVTEKDVSERYLKITDEYHRQLDRKGKDAYWGTIVKTHIRETYRLKPALIKLYLGEKEAK